MALRRLIALLAAAAAVAAGGCAREGESDRPEQSATLVLDGRPDAVHAGIYLAVARDFDGAEGVTLRVRVPSARDGAWLLGRGRAQFAVLSIDDLRFGDLVPARLRAWARWAARAGVAPRPPDVARAFAPGF